MFSVLIHVIINIVNSQNIFHMFSILAHIVINIINSREAFNKFSKSAHNPINIVNSQETSDRFLFIICHNKHCFFIINTIKNESSLFTIDPIKG